MTDLYESPFVRVEEPASATAASPNGTSASYEDEDDAYEDEEQRTDHSGGSSSIGLPPITPGRGKPNADEVFLRNMLGLLNKRGYNVRESTNETSTASSSASLTCSSSFTSTGSSTVSSVLLALREPNHGQSPLHIAVRRCDMQVLDALLEHESRDELLDVPDSNGNTALHFATGHWRRPTSVNVTEKLLAAGGNVHAENKRGLTPLGVHMLTLKIDNPTLVAKLLEAGADPNTEAEGLAVLHLAARRGLPVVSAVLTAFGASMLSLNADGLMCYEVASPRVKQFMARSINRTPPAYVSMTQRCACMLCKSTTLVSHKKVLGNMVKRVLGMHMRTHPSNCYHCGMLFCSQCLKPSTAVSAIPFVRDDDATCGKIKTCRLCEAVLLDRKKKQAAQHVFDMHVRGIHPTMQMTR
ncbi:unnamed protein product [Hyaloperonospora brassicae]|uniref:FYVE-type domain-containing protein n=1 Tax=Hyaloperonospora brassicae TaxID=162125 RepID=A0AAV0UEG0_HYABA|nr:unnamed protein product [Hyaloperonospora brassicae]